MTLKIKITTVATIWAKSISNHKCPKSIYVKEKKPNIKLHFIGRLQTNKVKFAIKIFDYIHSLDSIKLAKKIADEEKKQNRKIQLFIQVNIGNEDQKSGVNLENLDNLYKCCKELDLNVGILSLICDTIFFLILSLVLIDLSIIHAKPINLAL